MSLQAVLLLGAGSYLLRLVGLTALSAGHLPAWLETPLRTLPPAMLAALIATLVFDMRTGLAFDARMVGVALAVVLVWRRIPLVVVMVAAAGVTAVLRAHGW